MQLMPYLSIRLDRDAVGPSLIPLHPGDAL